MNKPSERIVVFVTDAQKRAITATADSMGISISELVRRAVLSFGATSEQVKAASIVDRLRAPRAPDALDAALQRVARGTRGEEAAQPAALQTRAQTRAPTRALTRADNAGGKTSASSGKVASSLIPVGLANAANGLPDTRSPAPLLPAGVIAALAAAADAQEAAETAEAESRMAAAHATEATPPAADARQTQSEADAQLRRVLKRPRIDTSREDEDPRGDPSTEGGRFA